MARYDGKPDPEAVVLIQSIHELRKSEASIEGLFAAVGETDDLVKTAEKLGLSGLDETLALRLKELVGDIDVDLSMPLTEDDSDLS